MVAAVALSSLTAVTASVFVVATLVTPVASAAVPGRNGQPSLAPALIRGSPRLATALKAGRDSSASYLTPPTTIALVGGFLSGSCGHSLSSRNGACGMVATA